MTFRSGRDAGLGVLAAVVAGALLWVTTGFDGTPNDRLFPQIILALAMALGVALAVSAVQFRGPGARERARLAPSGRSLAAIGVALAYPLVAVNAGFFATTFLFLTLSPWWFIRTDAEQGLSARPARLFVNSLVYAALATALLYVSFSLFLKFSLPPGVLI